MFFVTYAYDTLKTNDNHFGKDSILEAKISFNKNRKNNNLLKSNLGNFTENYFYRSFN